MPRSKDTALRVFAAVGIAAALAAGGCAVNDHGLARVQLLENDSAYLLRLDVWGAHLSTLASDAGLTLGYSRRTYVFARPDRTPEAALSALIGSDASLRTLREATCNPCPSLSELGEPLFAARQTIGLSLATNRNRVGLAAGLQSHAAIDLPRDRELFLFLRYNSQNERSTEVVVGKEIPR